jgi:GNAT superfamily N-acetyltransferase
MRAKNSQPDPLTSPGAAGKVECEGTEQAMGLDWKHEDGPARWDDDKQRIVGDAPDGTFEGIHYGKGDLVAGDWWRVEDGGKVVGYGWMDTVWGDAQILLAVDADARGKGVGTFILDHLESEAKGQGLNYLFNVVPPKHPDPDGITAWLTKRGFEPSQEDRLSRRVVGQ